MAVLNPVKVVIENYPVEKTEILTAYNNPENKEAGTRELTFSKEIYIDENDFLEDPPKKFFRLSLGEEVRLRYGYLIRCSSIKKDETTGKIVQINCTYDSESKNGKSSDGRRVKGIIHWVNAKNSFQNQVYLYDRLFLEENPEAAGLAESLNPESLKVVTAQVEPSLNQLKINDRIQFERVGYFYVDRLENNQPVFHKIVALKDGWSKAQKK